MLTWSEVFKKPEPMIVSCPLVSKRSSPSSRYTLTWDTSSYTFPVLAGSFVPKICTLSIIAWVPDVTMKSSVNTSSFSVPWGQSVPPALPVTSIWSFGFTVTWMLAAEAGPQLPAASRAST